ncbi:MAG: hypothetical protein ACD_67C00159G0001 [uncultured bacterium]|nr:MAG: hypothetical protein ACD_67C00159G0001 [uncultured bacterium]
MGRRDKKNTHAKRVARQQSVDTRGDRLREQWRNELDRKELEEELESTQHLVKSLQAYFQKYTKQMKDARRKGLISSLLLSLSITLFLSANTVYKMPTPMIIIFWILCFVMLFSCLRFAYVYICCHVDLKNLKQQLNRTHAKLADCEQRLRAHDSTQKTKR